MTKVISKTRIRMSNQKIVKSWPIEIFCIKIKSLFVHIIDTKCLARILCFTLWDRTNILRKLREISIAPDLLRQAGRQELLEIAQRHWHLRALKTQNVIEFWCIKWSACLCLKQEFKTLPFISQRMHRNVFHAECCDTDQHCVSRRLHCVGMKMLKRLTIGRCARLRITLVHQLMTMVSVKRRKSFAKQCDIWSWKKGGTQAWGSNC